MPEITSRPFRPNPEKCCTGCALGGEHERWCLLTQARKRDVGGGPNQNGYLWFDGVNWISLPNNYESPVYRKLQE